MARIYPNRLDEHTESMAERRLYALFRDRLPDDYLVFHSARWLVRDARHSAKEGEADFIIVDPARGMIVLEVKGGNIRHDGAEGQWYSNQYPIKDPFEQASRNKHNLLSKLSEMPRWHGHTPFICHAVAFPDVFVDRELRLDAPQEIILDANACNALDMWIAQVFDFYRPTGKCLDKSDLDALIEMFAPSRELRVQMRIAFDQEEEHLICLTDEQYDLLNMLRGVRRVAISGCAGTGKTMLAVRRAAQLAEQGFHVLLTCFNLALAAHLRERCRLPANVAVLHFHALCSEMAQRAGLPCEKPADIDVHDWFTWRMAEILLEAGGRLGPQFDAIIVDEGQDFTSNWWEPLCC